MTATVLAAAANGPPKHTLSPQVLRAARFKEYMAEHISVLGAGMPEQRVDRTVSHASSAVPVGVSVFRPRTNPELVRGVYLHIHGGSWLLGGSAWQNDIRLCAMSERLRIAIVSVDYRLAPDHKWPAPVDDCVTAAAWLVESSAAEFGTQTLVIGGESAGGHLCVSAMLRLRYALGLPLAAPYPYCAANLVYGVYDLGGTPSMRHYGERPLVFNTPDFEQAVACLLPAELLRHGPSGRSRPDISPLYAQPSELAAMPPALFTVGTDDPLLDDSLFMAARWASAGSALAVYPGGAHGIGHFGPHAATALGKRAHARIEEFVGEHLEPPR